MTRSTLACRAIDRGPKMARMLMMPRPRISMKLRLRAGAVPTSAPSGASRIWTTSSAMNWWPRAMSSRALSLLPMPLSPRMRVPRPKIRRKPAEMVVWPAASGGRDGRPSGTDLLLLGPQGLDDGGRRGRLEQLRGERPRPADQAGDGGQQPESRAGVVLGRNEQEEDAGGLAVDGLEGHAFGRQAEQQGR